MMIAVIGLGYVGLPLAEALSNHFHVKAFDIDENKIERLKEKQNSSIEFTNDKQVLKNNSIDMFIVCVPTPVDKYNNPDILCIRQSCHDIAEALKDNPTAVVVFESTVYPGLTEDFCKPILEKFIDQPVNIGYSPERINPGDSDHTLETITKLVAGCNGYTEAKMLEVYGKVCDVYLVSDIKTAEAAKVIENIQRDINIGLMNELAQIFDKMNISMTAVLDAAKTKWNFLDFKPGLVGGHCIGVDPYYLTYAAKGLALHPELVLAGRRVNDGMASYIVKNVMKLKPKAVGILGSTFKANVGDFRNSKTFDLIKELEQYKKVEIMTHDPFDDNRITPHYRPLDKFNLCDVIIKTVDHDAYKDLEYKAPFLRHGGKVFDIPGWSFDAY